MKGGAAAVVARTLASADEEYRSAPGMPQEAPDTPKVCAPIRLNELDDRAIRRVKQIGINYVLSGGPPIPWDETHLRASVDKLRAGGLKLGNLMIAGFPNTLYGRAGRDDEIEKIKQSIRAAGKVGLPVVEYNFYAHRAIEGYYEELGRGGAGLTAFDEERVHGLPPKPEEGVHTVDEMWDNIAYFLKAIIPVAERANVRLALHPNDPPVANSRGSGQIMGTVEGWKHLITIVDSPANGITFDCGVTREMGHDPVEICRYFGTRDRINHVHYRNVRVRQPYNKYTEVFIDEGENDMLAVMCELVGVKYTRLIYPEHERALDYDRAVGIRNQYPGGGGYAGMVYDVAYARAMLQAALELEAPK
ncbi:MAG: mannonate dehydratase [Acidobacteriaceae bacterium]|nr:mannonate dehydratase [Acidobacteriaceae bacterium]